LGVLPAPAPPPPPPPPVTNATFWHGCNNPLSRLQGTSVPIAIPMDQREDKSASPESPEEAGGIHAATFVPPHMLETRSGALNLTNSVHVSVVQAGYC